MNSKKTMGVFVLWLAVAAGVWAQDAAAIIRQMESNTVIKTLRAEGRMETRDQYGVTETTFIVYAEGDNKALIEFTSLEEEGQKILRIDERIHVYYPDADRTITIRGAALSDSVLGSDISYEDMTTGNKSILDDYEVNLKGSAIIEGRDCHEIDMVARRGNVPYYRQTMWIDKEKHIFLKIHKFARSGELLQETRVLAVREIGGYQIPIRLTIQDKLKADSITSMEYDKFEIDISLRSNIFSLRELSR